jgi:hypothetical protein
LWPVEYDEYLREIHRAADVADGKVVSRVGDYFGVQLLADSRLWLRPLAYYPLDAFGDRQWVLVLPEAQHARQPAPR